MKEEAEKAVRKMKTGKEAEDNIMVEMLNAAGELAVKKFIETANEIYSTGEITIPMKNSVFITLQKTPGTLECNPHRAISLLSHITKIILRFILERNRSKIRNEVSEERFWINKEERGREPQFLS